MKKGLTQFILFCFILLFFGVIAVWFLQKPKEISTYDAARAYNDVLFQTSLGPRLPGSQAHLDTIEYVVSELTKAGWQVELQQNERLGHPLTNIIARSGMGKQWVILGAHYDSRISADQDPDLNMRHLPVTGANDGASGVAVLLELARSLPQDLDREVWLVFFDLEDQGNQEGWEWILGSRAFADSLEGKPDAVVIIDMIGDADLNLYREANSDPQLTDQIWGLADELGYSSIFINSVKFSILDDHLPFIEKGIPAIDIIDFDYPYWHTVQDTADKVSAQSLEVIGRVLHTWLTR